MTNEGKNLVDDLTKMNNKWEKNITDFLSEEEVSQLKHTLFAYTYPYKNSLLDMFSWIHQVPDLYLI